MKASIAIKKYLESGGDPKVQTAEILEAKKATSKEEWEILGKQACKCLGEKYEPPE